MDSLEDFIVQKILELFYESLFQYFEAGEEGEDRSNEIHVTDLASLCLRRSFFLKKLSYMFSLDSVMRMAIGRKIHEIPLIMKPSKNDTYYHELSLEWEGIKGRIDEYYNGIVIDKKTTREIPRGPSDYVTKQLRYYRVLLEHNNIPVKEAIVIYIDVDHAYAKAFPVDVSGDLREIEEEMLHKKEILAAAMKTNHPPPREMGWWCNSCECASLCFGSSWLKLVEEGGRKCQE